MKKMRLFLSALAASAVLFACSDSDDNGPQTGGNIQARWNPTKTVIKVAGEESTENYNLNEPGCDKDYIEFAGANVLNYVIFFKNASAVCTPDAGEAGIWAKDDNTLTISGLEIGGFDYSGTYEIIKLTGSELRIRTSSTIGGIPTTATLYFTKATNQN
jgi:hypothetical protein